MLNTRPLGSVHERNVFLLHAQPALPCIVMGFAVGLTYALFLFGIGFTLGDAPFWQMPEGILGGKLDIQTMLSGYYWFAREPWHWQMMALSKASAGQPANAYMFDIAPLAAIAGKLLSRWTGKLVNPYPLWIVLAFGLNAAASVALVRALGARSVLATIAAAGFTVLLPTLHHRFGHTNLLHHWPFVGAMAAAIACCERRMTTPALLAVLVLMLVSAAVINLYIWVMTAGIFLAALLMLGLDGRIGPGRAALVGLPAMTICPLMLWAFGVFQVESLGEKAGTLGLYSMNLVSPFLPQNSGIFARSEISALSQIVIDSTGGQYEGYAYLGAGVLLMVGCACVRAPRSIAQTLVASWPLGLVIMGMATFAMAHRFYVMWTPLFTLPVPRVLEQTIFTWFRSNGRFFWPLMYLLLALGIVGLLRNARGSIAAGALAVLFLLQWQDTAPWRDRIAQLTHSRPQSVFGMERQALQELVVSHGAVELYPRLWCSSDRRADAVQNITSLELQLLAARANASMPGVYVARGHEPCGPLVLPRDADGRLRGVLVVLNEALGDAAVRAQLAGLNCQAVSVGMVCWGGATPVHIPASAASHTPLGSGLIIDPAP
jgi:hypothetical protein